MQAIGSSDGKITPAVLFPLMPNRHFLVNFGNVKSLSLFCLMSVVGMFCPLQLRTVQQKQHLKSTQSCTTKTLKPKSRSVSKSNNASTH